MHAGRIVAWVDGKNVMDLDADELDRTRDRAGGGWNFRRGYCFAAAQVRARQWA